jgi:hypothetical protein
VVQNELAGAPRKPEEAAGRGQFLGDFASSGGRARVASLWPLPGRSTLPQPLPQISVTTAFSLPLAGMWGPDTPGATPRGASPRSHPRDKGSVRPLAVHRNSFAPNRSRADSRSLLLLVSRQQLFDHRDGVGRRVKRRQRSPSAERKDRCRASPRLNHPHVCALAAGGVGSSLVERRY